MNWYKENNCRVCKKVFCCKKCREQHETLVHDIFANCDICLYGNAILKDPPEHLIKHIDLKHGALHCLFCKRFFGSLEEISKQNKCSAEHKIKDFEKSPYTPIQTGTEDKYESPPYFLKVPQTNLNTGMFSNLATSTPLQREENSKKINQEIIITPVNFSNINKEKSSSGSATSQRRVTFCETPVTQSYKLENDAPKTEGKSECQIFVTPSSGNSSALFHTAKNLHENLAQGTATNEINITPGTKQIDTKKIENTEEIKSTEIEQDDNTLWISATNASPGNFEEENKIIIDTNATTPVITKLKKRQVNVVVPIAVKKKESESESPDNPHSAVLNTSEPENVPPVPSEKVDEHASSLSTLETSEVLSETSTNVPGRIWTSVTRLVRNATKAVQELSHVTYTFKTPMKRSILECDSFDGPIVKRFKLTEIKCRRPIKELCLECSGEKDESTKITSNIIVGIKKMFIDKATQTDE